MSKIKECLCDMWAVTPMFAKISGAILAVLTGVYWICVVSSAFANFINATVGYAYRFVMAHLTNLLPFSLGETIVILAPLLVVSVIAMSIVAASKKHGGYRFVANLLGFIFAVLSALIVSLSCGYRTDALDVRMGVTDREVSADELYRTALWLIDEANTLADEVTYFSDGASRMPFDLDTLSDKLCDAYEGIYEKYPFIQPLRSNVKPIMLSEPMTYTHITGIYTFFTGEANVNVHFPDYSVVFTSAHELAHQRGISRENEANFIAFLVCAESDDPYVQYCAYTNMYQYVINALYGADPSKYYAVSKRVSDKVRGELSAYSEFFSKYRDSRASEVSDKINDTYLTLQGTEGVRSYGLVVDLAVAYYYSEVAVAE